MFLKYNAKLKRIGQKLRNNLTDTEKHLWSKIRGKQIKGARFYRQKTIGNFVVDFYCPKAKLVIEVDGGQHYEENGKEKDKTRDEYLQKTGLRVLRFTNMEVLKNIEGVIGKIYREV